jgi:hypothetical protein
MLLKTICGTAVADDLLTANPCRIRGAGQASKTEPATLEELAELTEAMPQRYRLMVLLAAWCGLRFGELAVRLDVDTAELDPGQLLVYRVLMRDQAAIVDLVRTVLQPLQRARGGAGPLLETCTRTSPAGTTPARRPAGCTCPSAPSPTGSPGPVTSPATTRPTHGSASRCTLPCSARACSTGRARRCRTDR